MRQWNAIEVGSPRAHSTADNAEGADAFIRLIRGQRVGPTTCERNGVIQERLREELRRFRDPLDFREVELLPRRRLAERFFLAPPSCLLTVRHARSSASPLLTPRFR